MFSHNVSLGSNGHASTAAAGNVRAEVLVVPVLDMDPLSDSKTQEYDNVSKSNFQGLNVSF